MANFKDLMDMQKNYLEFNHLWSGPEFDKSFITDDDVIRHIDILH